MKGSLATSLLAGTAVAAIPQLQLQNPLGLPLEQFNEHHDIVSKPLQILSDSIKNLGNDAKQLWEELAREFPKAVEEFSFFSPSKKHTRRPDTHWDHVVRGADVQALWVEGADGQKHRELDGKLSAYDLRVKAVDPKKLGVDPGVKQYSGYLDDNENDKHLFYWFFESRNDPKNDPVVLWLNGGPGCSSLTGLFLELGPSMIDDDLNIRHNPYSWNSNASVIFLDQPVNVGFSYGGGAVSDTVAAGKDVYALLSLFFKQFPEYASQDFHIAGESYAGHYIPVFASEILSHKNRNINLKSLLIGNGLTDPATQYPEYRPMACGDGGYPAVVDKSSCQAMEDSLPRCLSMIESCYSSESAWVCVPASIYCNNAQIGPYQRTGQNPYDVRIKCDDGNLCYGGLEAIAKWLNKREVMEALGAEVDSYDSCNMDINRNFLFHGDWMKPFHRLVPDLIKAMPVLVYAGDADFICNWLGNKAWTDALEWDGHDKYAAAPMQNLTLSGNEEKSIGQFKTHGNLTFMRIFGGGHMVPMDQPEASLDFFNRWLGGEWA